MITFPNGLSVTQLFIAQPPFTANPRHDDPETGQWVPPYLRTIEGMDVRFTNVSDGAVRITGHIGFQIERCSNDMARNWVELRIALDGAEIPGTRAGLNVWPWPHYLDMPFAIVVPIEAGSHRVELQARAQQLGGSNCEVFVKPQWTGRMQVEILEAMS